MDVVWLGLLGLMLAGWSVLDGANLGLGMLLRRIGRTGPERRVLLTALGPFLLGNVVQGVPTTGRPGVETLVGPYSLLWGAAVVTLHGAVFAALRLPRGRRERAAGTVRRAGIFALALLGAVGVLTPALGWAFACTAGAAAAPLLLAGLAAGPRLRAGVASADSLDLLAVVVFLAIPVLIAVQAWMWWTFRHRVGVRSAVFF